MIIGSQISDFQPLSYVHPPPPPTALMVQFDPIVYNVEEGGTASLRAVLNVPADRDVSVDFITSDGTATGMAVKKTKNNTLLSQKVVQMQPFLLDAQVELTPTSSPLVTTFLCVTMVARLQRPDVLIREVPLYTPNCLGSSLGIMYWGLQNICYRNVKSEKATESARYSVLTSNCNKK